eukprot:Tbor_TRINITY_DN6085_c1_g1::TRINITY_DN6085_c1_g1_i1::g.10778::m.10778
MTAIIEAFAASSVTTFLLYPYRDFCKYFNHQNPFQNINGTFALSRYRGMIENPSQPVLLSLPNTALLSIYTYYPSGGGAVGGGFLHGVIRNAIRVHIAYMQVTDHVTRAKIGRPNNVLSFFVGFSVAGLLSALTNGIAVQQCYYGSSGRSRMGYSGNAISTLLSDWWYVYRSHVFMTFITAPLRNAFGSVVSVPLRAGGIRSLQELMHSEVALYKEAGTVASRMFRDQGIVYFLRGTLLTSFKVSVPFGFCCALYGQLLRLG